MTRIAVVGAGKIGEALLSGLLGAGYSSTELMFTERQYRAARDAIWRGAQRRARGLLPLGLGVRSAP